MRNKYRINDNVNEFKFQEYMRATKPSNETLTRFKLMDRLNLFKITWALTAEG